MDFGETLKQIREARHLKQSDIASGLLSRTSISKIENNKQHPTYDSALELIANVGVTPSEFEYIRNGYRYPEKQLIVHKFTSLIRSPQFSDISALYSLCDTYLDSKKDLDVYHIKTILAAIYEFERGHYPAAKEQASVVWQSLKKIDTWTKFDLFLLNNILYFFDLDTAVSIAQMALQAIDTNYPHLLRLKSALIENCSLLLITNNDFSQAKLWIEKGIPLYKELFQFDSLNTAYAFLALCEQDFSTAEKYRDILQQMGDPSGAQDVTKEIERIRSLEI